MFIKNMAKALLSHWAAQPHKRSARRACLALETLEDRCVPTVVDTSPLVDFRVNNDWGNGFEASVTIANEQTTPLDNWRLEFDSPARIDSVWNAEIVSQEGGHYVLTHAGWNRTIAGSGMVSFGLTASPGGATPAPSGFVLSSGDDDTPAPGSAGGVGVDFTVGDDWGSGFNANVTLTNTSGTPLAGWVLEFDFAAQITSLWNAELSAHQGQHYVFRPVGWNSTIAPGASVSFGFTATPGGLTTEPTGYVLNGTPLGSAAPTPTPSPSLAIDPVEVVEGSSGFTQALFNVRLSAPSSRVVTVDYATVNGDAQAPSDYQAAAGTLTFLPGETQKTLAIRVTSDTVVESDETFGVVLSGAQNATIAVGQGAGTIVNDDLPVAVTATVSIADVTVREGIGASAAGFLHTTGNQLIDASGQTVRIAGINWFGLESPNFAPHGLWARGYRSMMDQMKELGYNTIRLPFSNQLLDPGNVPNGINFALNPDLQGLNGLQLLDRVVDYAGQVGLRIILDHHRSDAGAGAEGSGLWYSGAYPESRWLADWRALATRYTGNPTVLGADLHNEPHGPATWGSGSLTTDWRLAAERAGNAILAVNPDWLIFVEGIESYQGRNYWWGGNLAGARDFPVRLDVANRLVYSPHDYPASVYPQPWFTAATYPDNLPAVWDQAWGYLFREGLAPVWLGEFGSKLETSIDVAWANQLVNYLAGDLDGNGQSDLAPGELGMSWTWWSWNPNSGDTGGILGDDWTSVDMRKHSLLVPLQFAFPASTGSGAESTTALFTVSLSEPSTQKVSVSYATADGTAVAGQDYQPESGTLVFAPGETSKTIAVEVFGDNVLEGNENFFVNLAGAVEADIADGTGMATIQEVSGGPVDSPPPPSTTSPQVDFAVQDDWGAGFVAGMTITNNQTTALDGWVLEFDFAATLTSIWNAEIVAHVGNHYVIRAAAWNTNIAAGGSVSFGFQGAPGGGERPLNLVLNGVAIG